MGEARQRKAAGLGFKGPSKTERDEQKAKAKREAREKMMAANHSLVYDEESDELVEDEFDGLLQDGEEFWNDETQKWEPIFIEF